MSTKAPTIALHFDDGSGTYPIDLSSRLNQNGVSYQPFGRGDENTTAGTNTLSIRLKNNDGALSSGASQISVGQGLRLTYTVGATTVDQFTGRVQAAPVAWQGGPGKRADLMVTAVDLTAELSRRPMRSMLEQEIFTDVPTAYYTLGEAEGSTSAGDTSGNGKASLAIKGSGAPLAFGATESPLDQTAAQFQGGQRLDVNLGATDSFVSTTGGFSLECIFSTLMTTGSSTLSPRPLGIRMLGDTGGGVGAPVLVELATGNVIQLRVFGNVIASAVAVNDGALHHLAATVDGSGLLTGYLDGAPFGTVNTFSSWIQRTSPGTRLLIGDDPLGAASFVGVVACVAIYDHALSGARVASHAAALTGFSETTDARLSRIASYLGRTATTSAPSGRTMASQATSGQSFLSALEAVAEAEGGVLFIDGSGNIQLQGRYYRGLQTTAALTLTGKDVDPSTSPSLDDTQVINKVTVTRAGGAEQVALDQGSIDDIGEYPESLDLSIDADEEALGRAQWDVSKHASPGPRMPSVTFNMLTSAHREALLGASIGDRVSLTGMPSQQFAGLTDLTIEGWSDSLSISGSGEPSWKRTVNFLPWALFKVAIWDDPGSLWDDAVWGY